jgi:hypothetical protein
MEFSILNISDTEGRIEELSILFRVGKATVLYLNLKIRYPGSFRDTPLFLRPNAGIVP